MSKSSPPYSYEINSALTGLGEMLSVARRVRGDTLKDAAERCGVHHQTISRLEQGDPTVAIGTVFSVMSIYGMANRLFELSNVDEQTQIMMQKHFSRPRQ